MTSPVRLGVSPAAAPSPLGVFTQRCEALFCRTGALGPAVCFTPPPLLPVYLCVNVGPQGLLVVRPPSTFIPHSTSLSPAWQREYSPPWLPVSAPPTGLDEYLFFISLVSDFLAVQFSVSSGCARTRSMSTYAGILVLRTLSFDWSIQSIYIE